MQPLGLADDPLSNDSESEIELISEEWTPGPEVRNHDGGPVFPDRVFFAPPPPEIGEVLTASSTLRWNKKPMTMLSRFLLAGFVGSLVVAGLNLAGAGTIWQVPAAIVTVLAMFALTRFKHRLRYVGNDGLAVLTARSRPEKITRAELFLFANASELRAGETRQYAHGVYSGTSYSFVWNDASGKKVFKLSGTYYSEKKPPKPKDRFHFAESAERAWSNHLMDRATQEMSQTGALRFRLGNKDWVAVGPGFLEFCRKGIEERWEKGEIGNIMIQDGVFKLKKAGAQEGWFHSKGVVQFSKASISNAQVFWLATRRMLGSSGA
jgi:hypothetical protein